MNIAYFDCLTGLTEQMLLEALIGAGANRPAIEASIRRYTGLDITLSPHEKTAHLTVFCDAPLPPLSLPELQAMGNHQPLSEQVSSIWARLFEAEADVRKVATGSLTIHDVGGVKSLAGVLGVCEALGQLKIDQIFSTAIPLSTDHEITTPVVTALATNFPVKYFDCALPITPAGVTLLTTLVDHFTSPPVFTLIATGSGRASETTGLVRVCSGEIRDQDVENDIIVVETNIDDMNPQFYGYVVDLLLEHGALDAYLVPVIMKKGRPGNVLTVLVERPRLDDITSLILRETTTIGLRMHPVDRQILTRRLIDVETVYGTLRIKVVRHGPHVRFTPEYEDCLMAARARGVPLTEIYKAVHTSAARLDLDNML